MTNPNRGDTPLPGLEAAPPTAGDLELAVRRTLAALPAEARTEQQAARMSLALELAQVITVKRQTGRASTIGNDARVLVELLDKLVPAPTAGDEDEELRKALEEWREQAPPAAQHPAAPQ